MQEKTLEELLEDYAGIAVRYWRASGTSDEHKKDTEDMQEIARLISSREEKAREEGRKEERQFILNILDGIDIADKQMGLVGGTQAIRISLQNRII